METVQKETTYIDLQSKIKLLLARAVEMRKITVEELMAILFILGQTTTILELETFIEIFSESFPILRTAHFQRTEKTKINIEQKVKAAVSKMLLSNPLKATKLAKDAIKKGVTWEELVEKYPEIQ